MTATEPPERSTVSPEPKSQLDNSNPLSAASENDMAAVTATALGDPSATQKPPESESTPAQEAAAVSPAESDKWPGWPGDCVFRLVVPVLKVGSIIGRKGELVKKMCEETRARIRVLDAPPGTPDRVVLISGQEEPEAPLSPAMDAVLRIFKRVSGLSESEGGDGKASGAAAVAFCSIKLLVPATQGISLIGKQGSLIKSIQESTGASMRILQGDELPSYAATDERIAELQGEALKVLKALEVVVGHLRKFLVDRSVLPLFEKNFNALISQERQAETWPDKSLLHTASQAGIKSDYSLSRDLLYRDRETQLEPQITPSQLSYYGEDAALSDLRSSARGRSVTPIVTQVVQTMQIPLFYAEDIIGVGGTNIAYIRRTSGAILTIQESRGMPDEITVEIKGTSSQVQTAQQLIQECISSRHEEPTRGSYGDSETGLSSSYSQLGTRPYGGYGSSGVGGYGSYRF